MPTLSTTPIDGGAIAASAAILPGMARRHLQDQEVGVGGRAQHRPRMAELVVERPGRGDHLAQRRQHRGQQVLGRGLARRSGDPDDASARPPPTRRPPPRPAWPARPAPRRPSRRCRVRARGRGVGDRPARGATTIAGTPTGRAASTATAPAADGRGREIVAVGARARQRQEQPAGGHRARVELDGAGDRVGAACSRRDVGQLAADDLGDLGDGQVDHRAAPSAQRRGELLAVVERPGAARRWSGRLRVPCRRSAPRRRAAPSRPRRRWPARRSPISTTSRASPAAAVPGQDGRPDGGGVLVARVVVGDRPPGRPVRPRPGPSAPACPGHGRRRRRTPPRAGPGSCSRSVSSTARSAPGLCA